ncbi:hypothetical protein LWI29_001539 [Acer saccharum]|uniref:Uncharacterized protein n=1 Tax=Acer saccharum TaxID=4024 RepID=A0AA39W811_ACESA|nr:hypothetical protein LWI29_001539 [Acer saccharum]
MVRITKPLDLSNFSKEDMDKLQIEFEVERSKRMDEMDRMIKMNQELISMSTELVLARAVLKEENDAFQEFRCMHGKRSLGRGVHPPLGESSRVGRIVREVEEIPRQTMSTVGQEPRREDEAPPREEVTQETPTNQGQRMTMGEFGNLEAWQIAEALQKQETGKFPSHTEQAKEGNFINMDGARDEAMMFEEAFRAKVDDPGSFVIPISVGGSELLKGMLDLGASINMMPLALYEKLGLVGLEPTRKKLMLANQTSRVPHGEIKDIPILVDGIVISMDFVVLNIEEKSNDVTRWQVLLDFLLLLDEVFCVACASSKVLYLLGRNKDNLQVLEGRANQECS